MARARLAVTAAALSAKWAHAEEMTRPRARSTRFDAVDPAGSWPGPRGGHSFTAIEPSRIVLVGGSEGGEASNRVFEFDPMQMQWRQIAGNSAAEPLPASIGHCAVALEGKLICFGGTSGVSKLNGLWEVSIQDDQASWGVLQVVYAALGVNEVRGRLLVEVAQGIKRGSGMHWQLKRVEACCGYSEGWSR